MRTFPSSHGARSHAPFAEALISHVNEVPTIYRQNATDVHQSAQVRNFNTTMIAYRSLNYYAAGRV